MAECFYRFDGTRYHPTGWTRGPWSPDAQHAGPPAALLGRALEALEPAGEKRVARFALEILRPVPLVPLAVGASVARPGRRVDLCEARLADERGEVARASAWRIRPTGDAVPDAGMDALSLPGPQDSEGSPAFVPGYAGSSYFDAMEWRVATGTLSAAGPAAVWMRTRTPLVDDEDLSPLSRVLLAADSANGISAELPFGSYVFVNLDLTVHLARMPAGEWVCIDARTRTAPDGIGLAESVIWDERGRIGRGAQALLVAPTPPPGSG